MGRTRRFWVTEKALRARALAIKLMRQHGLNDWQFQFDGAIRRAGVCKYPRGDRPGRIGLSVPFCERNSDEEVRDTILHEIAHALVGSGHGHDAVWKAKCREIGAKPVRCYGEAVDMPTGSWRAVCGGCNKIHSRQRKPRRMEGWLCKKCGKVRGLLKWEKVG
jgi:predicted SprT family Zn-dependent metalloprotease